MADQNKRERFEIEFQEWLQNSEEGHRLRERFAQGARSKIEGLG